jgi:predicted component of type VI protein secretion system
MSSAVEAIAQLEAEVEYKRQQVAAQLVELRDRELKLHTATSELGVVRGELDETRSSVSRLEQAVADKDRALEARDARIATLQEELTQRNAEKRGADFLHAANEAHRPAANQVAAQNAPAPALICLTGDAPKRFVLTKKTVTVGRGPHCDLQIVTHFVSREHARLTVSGDATLIEDLGSRNGVFVNSVRVDRRQLQQGDLVTIGETQFRFVESMAH